MKVLITGGSHGLGECLCKKYANMGYDIVFTYYTNKNKALVLKDELKSLYNIKVETYCCDIKRENSVKELFSKIDKLDILINNASIAKDCSLENKDENIFKEVIDTNLLGSFLVTKYGSKKIEKGSIVFVSSTNGIDTPYIESIDYDASKAGIISLMHNFSKILSPNIRVNTVAPGWINTDSVKNMEKEFSNKEKNKVLLKRFGEPSEIANVIVFLTSEESSYINDAIIRVDGGYNG